MDGLESCLLSCKTKFLRVKEVQVDLCNGIERAHHGVKNPKLVQSLSKNETASYLGQRAEGTAQNLH